ncbi:MAG: hypothetical protein NT126_09425 [Bacteroidetes bacterium]|nr:hypothetical protein [Bacteroidota bacterium]
MIRTKIFLIHFLILASALSSHSQKITFCEHVDSSGNPKNSSTTFIIRSNGGYLEVLVTLPRDVNSSFVTYDLYTVTGDKKEIFENTIRQNVRSDFTWFSKKINFPKAGYYHVYVYDDRDHLLCAGRVLVKIE